MTLTVHYVHISRCLSVMYSKTFTLATNLSPLRAQPRNCSASVHMTFISQLPLDWSLNPILLIVFQFKLYWKQMLPN